MKPIVTFRVTGTPIPQGSTRAFAGKKGTKAEGKTFTTNDPSGSIGRWRGDVRSSAQPAIHAYLGPGLPVEGPVGMRLDFRLARPKSHYHPANSRRLAQELRADAPDRVAGGPDLDKLARAVLDALTGIVYVDDRQVAELGATKRYAAAGLPPGVDVRIVAL